MSDLPLPIDRAMWNAHRTIKGSCGRCQTYKIPRMNRWPDPPQSMPLMGWPREKPWGFWSCECTVGPIFENECRIKPMHACDESCWLAYHLFARHEQMRWHDVAELIDWPRTVNYLYDQTRNWARHQCLSWPPRERTT